MNKNIKYLVETHYGFNPNDLGKKDKNSVYRKLSKKVYVDDVIDQIKSSTYNKTAYPENMDEQDLNKHLNYVNAGDAVCRVIEKINKGLYTCDYRVYFKGQLGQPYDALFITIKNGSTARPVYKVTLDENNENVISIFDQHGLTTGLSGKTPLTVYGGFDNKQQSIEASYTDFVKLLFLESYTVKEYRVVDPNKFQLFNIKLEECEEVITKDVVENLPQIFIHHSENLQQANRYELFKAKVSPKFTYIFDRGVKFDSIQTVEAFIDKIVSQGIKRISIDFDSEIMNTEGQEPPAGYSLFSYTVARKCHEHKIPLAMEMSNRRDIVIAVGTRYLIDNGIVSINDVMINKHTLQFFANADKVQFKSKSDSKGKYYLFKYWAQWGPTDDRHWAEIIYKNYYSSICEIEEIKYLDQVYRDGKTIDLAAEK